MDANDVTSSKGSSSDQGEGLSYSQVKGLVAELNTRLENMASLHPEIVKLETTPDANESPGIQTSADQSDKTQNENTQAVSVQEKVEGKSEVGSTALKVGGACVKSTTKSTEKKSVHFADPSSYHVIEIEPSERRRRKMLAEKGERRREDKYPEFYKKIQSEEGRSELLKPVVHVHTGLLISLFEFFSTCTVVTVIVSFWL